MTVDWKIIVGRDVGQVRSMSYKLFFHNVLVNFNGGGRGIRTPGTVSRTVVFKTTAIDHSAIPPTPNFHIFRAISPISVYVVW
jgi:hypothetical protein